MPTKTPATCPRCAGRLVPVLYGEPPPEAGAAERRGELIIAGCVLSEQLAESACTACGFEVPYPEGKGPFDEDDEHDEDEEPEDELT